MYCIHLLLYSFLPLLLGRWIRTTRTQIPRPHRHLGPLPPLEPPHRWGWGGDRDEPGGGEGVLLPDGRGEEREGRARFEVRFNIIIVITSTPALLLCLSPFIPYPIYIPSSSPLTLNTHPHPPSSPHHVLLLSISHPRPPLSYRADAETVFSNAWDVLKRCPNITLMRSRTVVPMFLRWEL